MVDPSFVGRVWRRYTATADRFNDPGRFTALIGYEWTSVPKGDNLHRVVIYRDGKPMADQMLPFTAASTSCSHQLGRHLACFSFFT